MDASFLILIGIMLVVMLLMSTFTKRSAQKRQAEQEKRYKEQLVPGAWVCTTSGFYGRFVDLDGDVLILETPSGEETYWMKQVIRSIGDLPFAQEEEIADELAMDTNSADNEGSVQEDTQSTSKEDAEKGITSDEE